MRPRRLALAHRFAGPSCDDPPFAVLDEIVLEATEPSAEE